jgi:hypothetical protein
MHKLRDSLLIPAAVLLVSRMVIVLAAFYSGFPPMNPESYSRWDSNHYMAIASSGYEFFSCDLIGGFSPGDWCGNTGWFPGYPLLIRLVSSVGMTPLVSGFIISGIFNFTVLILIWNLFLHKKINFRNIALLSLAAFFPGCIYYAAVFPISLFVFLSLLFIYFLQKRNWYFSAFAGALAVFTYPPGILLAGLAGIIILMDRGLSNKRKILLGLVIPVIIASGFVAVTCYHYFSVGEWDAFFKVQAKNGYQFQDISPIQKFKIHLKNTGIFERGGDAKAIAIQSLFLIVLMVAGFLNMVWNKMLKNEHIIVLGYVLLYWAFPLCVGGHLSLYRAEALLLPLILILPGINQWILGCFLAVAIYISFYMDVLFFKSLLM